MNLLRIIFTCSCIALATPAFQEKSGWRGIVPLHSTRAEVERMLGPSTDSCECIYRTNDEAVHVQYASAPCKGNPSGWNVSADTVLRFTVTPKTWQRFSDLGVDHTKYLRTVDHDNPTTHYTNKDDGIKYTVTDTGMVYYISYMPSVKNDHLRCANFPVNAGSTSQYQPFDFYSDIKFKDEKTRLDNFAAWLYQHTDLTGYILVYAGRRAGAREAKVRADRAKHYIVRTRRIKAERLITIDGGHREKVGVELYALPSQMDPPIPRPNLDPNQVQIIKVKTSAKSRKVARPRSKLKYR